MSLLVLLLIFIAGAAGLTWFLLAHDKGQKEPVIALWLAAGLGFLGALAAGFIENKVVVAENFLPGTPYTAVLLTAMSVGFIEEVCKFLPLALILYKKHYFNEHTDGVIYFALAGLGFGLPENILYTLDQGTQVGVARLFLTPLFHAAVTGMVGYYLAKRKLAGKPVIGIVGPLSAAIVLHSLYNFGLVAGSTLLTTMALLITLGISGGLFLLFLRATERDQDSGLSTIGHNSFCRTCGWANPGHHLYCTHCGKNA